MKLPVIQAAQVPADPWHVLAACAIAGATDRQHGRRDPPRATAVLSGELDAPTQRDRHLAMITEQGRQAWQVQVLRHTDASDLGAVIFYSQYYIVVKINSS